MGRKLFHVALLLVVLQGLSIGAAEAGVGTTVQVTRLATASGENGLHELFVGTDVFMGDLLQSGPIGEAQIVFLDQTRLVVGPNSSLLIDEFVVSSDQTAKEISVQAEVPTLKSARKEA